VEVPSFRETMEFMQKGKPYPPELRERAVAMVLEWRRERNRTDRGLAEVGEKLGVHPESICNWRYRHQTDAGERPGLTTDERQKMKELERENRELKRTNEIPRWASAFFAAELDRPRSDGSLHRREPQRAPRSSQPICRVLQVAPSTYYARRTRPPSTGTMRDALLVAALTTLWSANYKVYGVRKLWRAAQRAGHDVGRDQVARLMGFAGIEGLRRGKKHRTTRPDPGQPRHPDLVHRSFGAGAPDHLWVTAHLRPHLVGIRLRVLHHRRLLPDDRGMAGGRPHAHLHGPRRHRDGPMAPGNHLGGVDRTLRRRVPGRIKPVVVTPR
jgi:putative transposase